MQVLLVFLSLLYVCRQESVPIIVDIVLTYLYYSVVHSEFMHVDGYVVSEAYAIFFAYFSWCVGGM